MKYYRFISLFLRIVFREWHDRRITLYTAYRVSYKIWLMK